jgi:hypothetical protein
MKVFIVGNAKSGTTLLQALLDGHSELFVLPIELKFFKFPALPSLPPGNMPPPPAPEWKMPVPRAQPSVEQVRDELLGHSDLADLLNGANLARNVDLSGADFDEETFLQHIQAPYGSLKELYVAFFEAFYYAFGDERDVEGITFVEKTPSNEEYAQELNRWFPDVAFLHMLRNPYANVYSLQQGGRRTPNLRDRTYRPTAKSLYFMERNQRYIENYHVVKYEDLVRSTEETMRQVAQWIGVDFDDTLLQPTIMGQPWGGNARSVDEQFDGVDPRPLTAYEEHISDLDIALVNRFFSELMAKYGYSRKRASFKKWLPRSWETPLNYLRNRLLLHSHIL